MSTVTDDTCFHARESVLRITGTVQGVGFRPFVARLATRHGVRGWVRNDAHGVTVRMSGSADAIAAVREALHEEAPAAARIDLCEELSPNGSSVLPPISNGFVILASPPAGIDRDAAVSPDLALCDDCRRELLDPNDRRYRYPFINCTNCGPRYSIVRELPYDRGRTTMAGFTMCPDCQREYDNATDRRYHAQPNACPECGPHIEFLAARRSIRDRNEAALKRAVISLRAGRIVAVKGIGGFHLLADAQNEDAVQELRRRKHREEKPLAVMFPSLRDIHEHAEVTTEQADLLQSPAAPIVLVRRHAHSTLADSIAPGNPWIGAFLPYAPLHVMLLESFAGPTVATSANLSEEPLCIDNDEAFSRLCDIADDFLVHDRPIARPVDDSVVRFAASGPILLRRARGYAPTPLPLPTASGTMPPTLCVGGHLKNTIGVTTGDKLVLSPHIGDLANPVALEAFRSTVELLTRLYGDRCEQVVCDAHPDYASTRFAAQQGLPVIRVQHHLAHVLACLLEHGGGPVQVLGVAWDGTGYGDDGTIWGGEFILIDREKCRARRVAHLRPFVLPGGEAAVRDPRRSLLGAMSVGGLTDHGSLATAAIDLGFKNADAGIVATALQREINSPTTTSAGRLFDAVAALLGLCQQNAFEGQAAMAVEFAADAARTDSGSLPWAVVPGRNRDNENRSGSTASAPPPSFIIDWAPTLAAIRESIASGIAPTVLAMRFHRMLADSIVAVARELGVSAVALSGGCFQNALLTDLTATGLRAAGFNVLLHRTLPPNDNSIAAGQALAAQWGITSTSA